MKWSSKSGNKHLVSQTGHALVRRVSFRNALDVTDGQSQLLCSYAGARRFAYNHHVGRIKANLDARDAEGKAGVVKEQMTPPLSWSAQSFINEFNAWKNDKLPTSPVGDDGGRGLAWRGEISADVFECASVDTARAFTHFSESEKGARAGRGGGRHHGLRRRRQQIASRRPDEIRGGRVDRRGGRRGD